MMTSRAQGWWFLVWTLGAARALSERDTSMATPSFMNRPEDGTRIPEMANESAATPLISRITHIVLHGVMGSVLLTWSPQPHDEPAVTTPTVVTSPRVQQATPRDLWVLPSSKTTGLGHRNPGRGWGQYHESNTDGSDMDSMTSSPSARLGALSSVPSMNAKSSTIHPLNISVWGTHLESSVRRVRVDSTRYTQAPGHETHPLYHSNSATWRTPSEDGPRPVRVASGADPARGWSTTSLPLQAPPSGNETRPHYHPHGTFFEDGPRPLRVTARVGSTVTLDCKVAMLQGKTVTWLHRDGGRLRLLTVGRQSYSADGRLQVLFRYPGNWRLRIAGLAPADQGEYRCQVSAHPPLVKTVLLVVTAPVLAVVDDAGRPVGEDRYYKAGSRVELSCEASSLQPGDTVAWSRRGRPLAPRK